MFPKIFNIGKDKLYQILSAGSVAFAVLFLVVVSVVVYRGMSEAFLQSEQTLANVSTPDIKGEDLLKAVGLAEQWKRQQAQVVVPTVPVVKKSDIVIDVLNGTVETGLASVVADKLILAGFTNIRQVSTSVERDLQVTQLQRKPSVSLYEELVMEVLGLTTKTVIVGDLSETAEFDMVVIIGQDLSGL